MCSKKKVSHKSEMAGPLNRGDTIINKHFTFYFYTIHVVDHLEKLFLEYTCSISK
jgi:hypothetical protein